jgi:hypothetical protein
VNGLGESLILTFSQCSSSIDERQRLRTHLNIGLTRHGGTTDIGSRRVGSVGIGSRGFGLVGGRDGGWRGRSDLMIDQRTNSSGGRRRGTSLSVVRDLANIGLHVSQRQKRDEEVRRK